MIFWNDILMVPPPCNTVIFSLAEHDFNGPSTLQYGDFFLQGYFDGPSTLQYGDFFPARLFWWSLYLVERIPPSCMINTRALGERVGTVFFFFLPFFRTTLRNRTNRTTPRNRTNRTTQRNRNSKKSYKLYNTKKSYKSYNS